MGFDQQQNSPLTVRSFEKLLPATVSFQDRIFTLPDAASGAKDDGFRGELMLEKK